ncbi:MAG: Crp/Fnr family transcriptional regulator [Curvibacter sp.]|nr:MAG: Crp/Fnr family transcriptional regulator [Curvibacter sp.]
MPQIVSNLDLLRRVPLFAMLTPIQADALEMTVEKQSFQRGEILARQHSKSDQLLVLLSGQVRLVTTGTCGRQLFLNKLRTGDVFDEMSLIDDKPHSATAIADASTDVLILSRDDFLRCLEENSHVAFAFMNRLVDRLRRANRRIEAFALLGVHGRVGLALVENASLSLDGSMVIDEKISRQDLAKMVGASRERVSRVMKDLEAQGFIRTDSADHLTLKSTLLQQFFWRA